MKLEKQNKAKTAKYIESIISILSYLRRLTSETGENESCFKDWIPGVYKWSRALRVNTVQGARAGKGRPLARGKWGRSRQYELLLPQRDASHILLASNKIDPILLSSAIYHQSFVRQPFFWFKITLANEI